MARPASFIARFRDQTTTTLSELLKLRSMATDEWNAVGGADFIDSFFKDENGVERTDLDLTKQEFVDGVASSQKLTGIATGDLTNLFRLRS